MVKHRLVIITLILALLCFSISAESAYTIALKVDFEENLFFSTYDVDLYVNDTQIGTYKHGVDFEEMFMVAEGKNILRFCKKGSKTIKGEIEFNASDNLEIKCHIACKSEKVKVSSVKMVQLNLEANTESIAKETETIADNSVKEDLLPMTPQEEIESVIRSRIEAEYYGTDIDSITINEHLGTDKPDDYIALVYLTWNTKNSGSMSKTMLKMYSDDLASITAKELPNVQEIAIFWTVPYLKNANAKCSYERKGTGAAEGMYEMDMMWDSAFR